ncbi:hypothetical protein Pmar_PMAR021985 [Perkinsus marinus ATCC 50983]|uniref:C3H1-type domain-containing protein n=1 Tax=Perkinsus marinus (strain ATCC 50983 / TXsc) TaxID=423536 RepID=C5LRQ4_PERM5|nr:hypothetical protein Pmar_PMAR021985 [Perkinsus marinus ATCC 50983]EER00613.1 hypothetical protein Pmar_PMAR021985 [Perkinsus marinus ATCC 50983]|eukprot:XP_002767895.1 hypothetical protein Pmar_PMAR021985 [Perkinsus marinus ATCC 50983]
MESLWVDSSISDTTTFDAHSPQLHEAPIVDLPDWASFPPLPSPYAATPRRHGGSRCIRQQLRNTRACKHFLNGCCYYGANCTFAHHDNELFKKPNLAKTKLCPKLFCEDAACTYAHSSEELRQPGEFSDMDAARVDVEHEKVLGEQRTLLTVIGLMSELCDDGKDSGLLPSPGSQVSLPLLPTPPMRCTGSVGSITGRRSSRPSKKGPRTRRGVKKSALYGLATQNEELRRQVEMSNTVFAHVVQMISAQAPPVNPVVESTSPMGVVFSQQQRDESTSDTADTTSGVGDNSEIDEVDADALAQLLATVIGQC